MSQSDHFNASVVSYIEQLRLENQRLSDQVKQLVKTEGDLYEFQEQLDEQLRIYSRLYENGKKLNTTFDPEVIFQAAIQFVIYELNFERCLIFLRKGDNNFHIQLWDGYFDKSWANTLSQISLPVNADIVTYFQAGADVFFYPSDADDAESTHLFPLGEELGLHHCAIYPLGTDMRSPLGLLIVGNTAERSTYHAPIRPQTQAILGLANLASQVSTAMNNVVSYAALQEEQRLLEEKVKQLVRTELQLYTAQEQLDAQLHIYRKLYEMGKQFNATFEVDKILTLITHFVLYELNFERCLVLLPCEHSLDIAVCAHDGYYDRSVETVQSLHLSSQHPALVPLSTSSEYVICPEGCTEPTLRQLSPIIAMDEYVLFPIGGKPQSDYGLLIVGNTMAMAPYQTRIEANSESILGLANLVSQASTAINNAKSYRALQQEQELLEAKVKERTQELNQKNTFLEQTLEELQQAQLHLIQSEKMSSLGQLVAGVAHEINNPVNFIYGNIKHANQYAQDLLKLVHIYQNHCLQGIPEIETILNDIDLEFLIEDFPKVLDSMHIGAQRIQQIVLSLRTFSRMDEAERKAVDLHAGIDSTLVILQNRLKPMGDRPAIEIRKSYGNLPLIECYAGQLNQVFMNILVNAIDALEDWNETRTCDEINRYPAQIHIGTEMISVERVRIWISDNGPGIPEEHQRRLFDPFFTTKPIGKGTGLGLSISYQIVTETHGGTLKCISARGQGTKFLIEIPTFR